MSGQVGADADIEALIQQELDALHESDLDDIEDDDDSEDSSHPNLVVDVSEEANGCMDGYLSLIKAYNEEAEKRMADTEHMISALANISLNTDDLLKKKLCAELGDEVDDVMQVWKKVCIEIDVHELENGCSEPSVKSPPMIEYELDEISLLESKAVQQYDSLLKQHFSEEKCQLMDIQSANELEEMQYRQEARLEQLKELELILNNDFSPGAIAASKIKSYDKVTDEEVIIETLQHIDERCHAEKLKLEALQNEMKEIIRVREKSAATMIQKHFKRYYVQKLHREEVNQIHEAVMDFRKGKAAAMIKEQEMVMAERKRKEEELAKKKEMEKLEKERKEREKKERKQKYEEQKVLLAKEKAQSELEEKNRQKEEKNGKDEGQLEQVRKTEEEECHKKEIDRKKKEQEEQEKARKAERELKHRLEDEERKVCLQRKMEKALDQEKAKSELESKRKLEEEGQGKIDIESAQIEIKLMGQQKMDFEFQEEQKGSEGRHNEYRGKENEKFEHENSTSNTKPKQEQGDNTTDQTMLDNIIHCVSSRSTAGETDKGDFHASKPNEVEFFGTTSTYEMLTQSKATVGSETMSLQSETMSCQADTSSVPNSTLVDRGVAETGRQSLDNMIKSLSVKRRERYMKRLTPHAIKIQSLYRGYRVRKAYAEIKRLQDETETSSTGDSDDSNCVYDEVNLDEFELDNSVLEWTPNMKTPAMLNEPPLPNITPPAVTAVEISVREAWQTSQAISPTETSNKNSTFEVSPTALSFITDAELVLSRNTSASGSYKSVLSKKASKISSEWGFQNDVTAELMLKRSKKLGTGKKKATSSSDRYELFKKVSSIPTLQGKQITSGWGRRPERVSYFQANRDPPSPIDQKQLSEKNEATYSWVCTQPVLHADRAQEVLSRNGKFYREHENILVKIKDSSSREIETIALPPIDPAVLAGRPLSLVQSEVHNPQVPTVKERCCSSSEKVQKYVETKPHSEPIRNLNKCPTDGSEKCEKWTNYAYR